MKKIFEYKKIIAIFISVVIMMSMVTVGALDTDDKAVNDANEMTYVGMVDNMPTWITTIPVEWTSNEEYDRAITGSCEVAIQYQGGSSFRCRVTYLSYGDKVKEIKGDCNTYGPYGSDSQELKNKLLFASDSITASVGFTFGTTINKPVTQYFHVKGTVTGKNGDGKFEGTRSINVSPARMLNK